MKHGGRERSNAFVKVGRDGYGFDSAGGPPVQGSLAIEHREEFVDGLPLDRDRLVGENADGKSWRRR